MILHMLCSFTSSDNLGLSSLFTGVAELKMLYPLPVASRKNLLETIFVASRKIYSKSFYSFFSFLVFLDHNEKIGRETRETGFARCPTIDFFTLTHI
jgi:hypothetical protein